MLHYCRQRLLLYTTLKSKFISAHSYWCRAKYYYRAEFLSLYALTATVQTVTYSKKMPSQFHKEEAMKKN